MFLELGTVVDESECVPQSTGDSSLICKDDLSPNVTNCRCYAAVMLTHMVLVPDKSLLIRAGTIDMLISIFVGFLRAPVIRMQMASSAAIAMSHLVKDVDTRKDVMKSGVITDMMEILKQIGPLVKKRCSKCVSAEAHNSRISCKSCRNIVRYGRQLRSSLIICFTHIVQDLTDQVAAADAGIIEVLLPLLDLSVGSIAAPRDTESYVLHDVTNMCRILGKMSTSGEDIRRRMVDLGVIELIFRVINSDCDLVKDGAKHNVVVALTHLVVEVFTLQYSGLTHLFIDSKCSPEWKYWILWSISRMRHLQWLNCANMQSISL